MTNNRTLSHLLTFLFLGGIMITVGCLLLGPGHGLYA